MAAPKGITEDAYEAAIRKRHGIKALVAQELDVSRSAVQQRIDGSPHLQAVLAEVAEAILDSAEGNVVTAITGNDLATSKWYLERKGKARGYVVKTELEGRIADDDIARIARAVASGDVGDLERLRATFDPSTPL